MRVTTLGSGSGGNSILLETAKTKLLIDAGLRADEISNRLESIGRRPRDIDGILLTHRHKDHTRGASDFARAHRARIFAVRRTMRVIGSETRRRLQKLLADGFYRAELFPGISVWPIEVRHDAPQTRAFLIETPTCRYGHVTDLGCLEGRVGEVLTACDGLYLEFNHDEEMVRRSKYPLQLKNRILSDDGHLSNAQGAELLRRIADPRLRCLWLAHLSQVTNDPELAQRAASAALEDKLGNQAPNVQVVVASQSEPGPTIDLSAPATERKEQLNDQLRA